MTDTRPLLVTGCSRSGTKYLTFLLREFDIVCGHERYARDGIVAWQLAPPDTGKLEPPWGCPRRKKGPHRLFHIVRDPYKAIPSLAYTDWGRSSRVWRRCFINLEDAGPDTTLLTRATLNYCRWNALVPPQQPELTIRLEEAPETLERHLGIPARSLPAPCNQRRHPVFTPQQLLNDINGVARRELKEFCAIYGYEWRGD